MDNLINELIKALEPVLLTFLTAAITYVLSKGSKYISIKSGIENYERAKNYAVDVWHIVEEYYRLHPNEKIAVESKINMFECELRKKLPHITNDEIEHLRQAIAGEINKDKAAANIRVDNVAAKSAGGIDILVVVCRTSDGVEKKPVASQNEPSK